MSLESVDDVTRSLNELRFMLAANDLSGVRKLVYFGQLDWLRERLEPREYFALRDRVNAGDMQWLRSRFLSSDITWIKHAVQRGDTDALRIANRLGQLGWLAPIIPADDFRQLGQRVETSDLAWLQQRLDTWSLETLVDVDPATPPLITDTMGEEGAEIVAPSASAAQRVRPSLRSSSRHSHPPTASIALRRARRTSMTTCSRWTTYHALRPWRSCRTCRHRRAIGRKATAVAGMDRRDPDVDRRGHTFVLVAA